MTGELHGLLARQIKSLGLTALGPPTDPQKWKDLIALISETYNDVDQERSRLEKQATHDGLTGLPNRTILIDRIQHAISVEARKKMSFGVLFFDLDRFKLINDSLSHQVGDELLRAVANRVQSTFRLEDTIARVGGDEFVMLALDLKREKSITHIASKLVDLFKYPFNILNRDIFITTSVGISLYPEDGKTAEELLSNADIAMYHAKEKGNNQFQFYTKGITQLSYTRLKKENELRQAFRNEEFFLCYQPQFDLITQEIVSVEALLRWNHPQQGIKPPLDFISIAEEIGLIIPLGEWILKEACTQNKRWQDRGLPPICVAVNVSNLQFKQANFLSMLDQILRESGLKPEYLEIEVSENVIISNPEVIRIISELKKMGIKVALDDFGTGSSSLNYLKTLQIDHLKVDQYFVKNIGINKSDEVIIQAIIDIARGLNYNVLAEGVETEDQLNFLKSKQCEALQGFLFGKPLPAKEFELFFKRSLERS